MPIKEAVKRLVRTCGLRNHMMDFKTDSKGKSQLVKIDLYISGSGQRLLTHGREKPVKKVSSQKSARAVSAAKKRKDKLPYKSSFTKDTDFVWDGSAPIAFPEYQGEIAYDQSEFGWDDQAKAFSDNTMDLIPPGVRDMVSEQIIKMSDQIAKERGTDKITSDITAEAIRRIAKQAKMPPQVMDLVPESMDDFDRAKIPIDPDQLSEEYRN
jgi:hypothetical protein